MFIQIMQGKCSREDEMRAALDRWRAECEPAAEGWLGGTYGFTDDGTFVGVIRFASEEAAMRNSARPEQGRWWTLHQARPEIVGATFAVEDDGTFTETVAFTDEATARANESTEMPQEMGNWEEQATMHDVQYMDLHHPFFATHGQGGAGR